MVSVSGKPGLHKIIGKSQNGLVLESLDGSAKRMITPVTQKVSVLEDVSIYTEDSDIKLLEVFKKMSDLDEKGNLGSIEKSNTPDQIKSWFASIIPDYNKEKVYNSDILKVCNWYSLLKGKMSFDQTEDAKDDAETPVKEVAAKKTKGGKNIKTGNTPKAKTSKGAAKTTITSRKMS